MVENRVATPGSCILLEAPFVLTFPGAVAPRYQDII